MTSGFKYNSTHITAPEHTNVNGIAKSILANNPVTGFKNLFNQYLQGQHNIGVAEARNELLGADSRQATLDIMDRLRSRGITDTQSNDADAQGILDKNGVKNPLVLGKLLQIAPEGSLKELPEVSKGFDQLVLPGMPGYIEESEAKRNELIRQGEMLVTVGSNLNPVATIHLCRFRRA